MTSAWPGSWRLARAAGQPWLVPSVVAAGAVAVVVQSPIAIPFSRAAERLWPLASAVAIPAGVWLIGVGHRWLEMSAGRARRARAARTAVILLAVALPVVVVLPFDRSAHGPEIVRNAVLVLGITLLGGATSLSWLPPFAFVAGCWLIGSSPPGLPPASWALLLQPATHAPALFATVLAGAAGIGRYVLGASGPSC